jgi:hypothetical protein
MGSFEFPKFTHKIYDLKESVENCLPKKIDPSVFPHLSFPANTNTVKPTKKKGKPLPT